MNLPQLCDHPDVSELNNYKIKIFKGSGSYYSNSCFLGSGIVHFLEIYLEIYYNNEILPKFKEICQFEYKYIDNYNRIVK